MTCAKVWQEMGIPPVADFYFYEKLKERMRPMGFALTGRNRGFGSGTAATRKKRIRK